MGESPINYSEKVLKSTLESTVANTGNRFFEGLEKAGYGSTVLKPINKYIGGVPNLALYVKSLYKNAEEYDFDSMILSDMKDTAGLVFTYEGTKLGMKYGKIYGTVGSAIGGLVGGTAAGIIWCFTPEIKK